MPTGGSGGDPAPSQLVGDTDRVPGVREPGAATARLRLGRRGALVLTIAVLTVAIVTAFVATRSAEASGALTDYHVEYTQRGGEFVAPTDLERTADRYKLALFVAILACVVMAGVLTAVVLYRRVVLRLDDQGLWYSGSWGVRWKGPIPRSEVQALREGLRARHTYLRTSPLTMLLGALTAGVLAGTGLLRAVAVYLRDDRGVPLHELPRRFHESPAPPFGARSFLVVPEVVFDTNPEFLTRLRRWMAP